MGTMRWTNTDLAELTSQAAEHAYCIHCTVVMAQENDELCGGCLDTMLEDMAQRWEEDKSMSFYR